ncbi:MAG: ribonuclease D [Spirochaetaceae bacterium]|nr:ribonuclease D [Spirochaetaceae bacterium]
MKDHLYIKTNKALSDYRNQLFNDQIEIIAIDFEAEYNLHEYGERLCLIQIYDGKRFVIIDPFLLGTNELKQILENKNITKIFYDASSDKALVYKQYGIRINSILDLMDFVQLLELQKKGLDSVLDSVLNISVSKKKQFQMHNWTIRPINNDALQYALSDVEYLFPLKDALLKKIINDNLYEDLLIKVINTDKEINMNTVPGVKKRKTYKSLSSNNKKIFDNIYTIRDKYAKKLNWPPNNEISNDNVLKLAKNINILDGSFIHPKTPGNIRTEILVNLKEMNI